MSSVTRRTGWTRDIPDRYLLAADLGGLGFALLVWAAGWLVYVPHICVNDPTIGGSIASNPYGRPAETMVNTVTWQCDFGNGSGLFTVVDHGPLAWTIFWGLMLGLGIRAAVRHQRALMW